MDAKTLELCVGCGPLRAEKWAGPLTQAFERFDICSNARMAAFIGQHAHETGGLLLLEENLKYSAQGLRAVFKKYFTDEEARDFEKQPERIANRVYANRMGNGDEASGDGWDFRGRGLNHLTGRANYIRAGEALKLNLVEHPEMVTVPAVAALVAGWFWKTNGMNSLADLDLYDEITERFNGGQNGREDRRERWNLARNGLGLVSRLA